MSWLFEDPTTLIVAGLLIEGLLAVALVKSGRALLIVAMVGVLVLVGLGVLVERLVVTDREQIETALSGVCSALEANDVEGVLSYIDPAAAGMRSRVQSELSSAHIITEVRLFDLDVHVDEGPNARTAQAEFTGRVKGNYRGEAGSVEGMLLRKFTVDFRRQGERWLMIAYEDRGPIGGRRDD